MSFSKDPARQSIWPETLAFAALWALWFAWFYRLWPLWDDHAVYHLMAANWIGGGKPYVDAIDPNWPGTMLLHAIAFALSGYEVWGFRLLDAGLQIGLATVTFYLMAAWRVDRLWRVTAVALYTITYFNGTFGTMGQREAIALPFLMGGLLPWLLPADRARSLPWAQLIFVHGACLGIAVSVKPPMGVAMIAVGLSSLWVRQIPVREWLRFVTAGAAGGVLWLAVVVAILAKSGSLAAFWQWGVKFAFSDYVVETVPWAKRGVHVVKWLTGTGALTSMVLLLGLFLWRRKRAARTPWLTLLVWLIAGFLIEALVQGKTYCLYHFLPFLWALAVLAATLLDRAELPMVSRQHAWIYAGIGGLLLVCSIGYSRKPSTPTSGYTLGQQLRAELRSGENVVIIGFAPTLYLALEKQPPYPILNSMLFYVLSGAAQEGEETRLISILSDPRHRYFMIDSIVFETKRPWTRVDRRSRIATFLQEHFSEPKIREVRGNPLEFAEPVQYLIYERKAGK